MKKEKYEKSNNGKGIGRCNIKQYIIAAIIILTALTSSVGIAGAADWHVYPDDSYPPIQNAINNASPWVNISTGQGNKNPGIGINSPETQTIILNNVSHSFPMFSNAEYVNFTIGNNTIILTLDSNASFDGVCNLSNLTGTNISAAGSSAELNYAPITYQNVTYDQKWESAPYFDDTENRLYLLSGSGVMTRLNLEIEENVMSKTIPKVVGVGDLVGQFHIETVAQGKDSTYNNLASSIRGIGYMNFYVQDAVDAASTGDTFIVYSPIAYAGKDIITHVGFPTHFRGYGISPDGEIIKYEWDFDGDDRFDWYSTLSGEAFHIYNITGTYYAKLRIYDSNNLTSMDSVKVTVKSGSGPQEYTEPMLPSRQVPAPPEVDGIKSRYVVMINGLGYEHHYWADVTFMYSTLINDYDFTAEDIFLVNHDGKNPDGENPNNMIDYPASKSNLDAIFYELAGIVDSNDLLFIFVTDHGRGYHGPQSVYYGYLDGFASVDPGDEEDYLESDFKLRSFCTYGNYYCNHGMDIWKVYYRWSSSHNCYGMYRNKFVSSFTDIYFEGPTSIISDDDIFIERSVDYLLGDTDRDGYIETSEGEVYDYDGDGNPPYDHATETFDEDDWGEIDKYEDNVTHLNTGVPYDNYDYIIFDDGFDNCVDIDLYSACDRHHLEDCDVSLLEVDGTDLDNQGLFDGIDINDDGDMNDWVSIDEKICLYWAPSLRDDEMATYLSAINAGRIVIVMLPCFSGGFIEDLSAPNRVILTATVEELSSWGNRFLRRFTAALHWADINGNPVNADSDGNGYISMLEAFNYAAENDDTPPQYDDNGDGIGHPYPIPNGGDGDLGAVTYLEWNITPLPDLVISDKWLCWPDNCMICYNVTNTGDGTAPACHNTALYVDDVAVAHDHVPVALAPGERYTGCFNGYEWGYTPPSDDITVCADNNKTIDELDETNNCLTNIWMCGDVNCDSKVTMSDVRKVFNRYLDPNYPLDLPWAADVNCDGKVSMSDVRKVFNRYLDPGYELNCCCRV
jgi:hypothetical protein